MKPLTLPKLTPEMRSSLINKGLYLCAGVVVLIVAHQVATIIKRTIYMKGQADAANIDSDNVASEADQNRQIRKTKLMFIILGHMAYYSIMALAILIVLKLLGIEATSIIALLGATGFTIGLALQGTLSDISSGILLGLLQIYTIGDLIETQDGIRGRVKDFNLTRTILTDIDTNAVIIIPNRKMSENTIINHTRSEHRKIKFEMRISNKYEEFDKLISILEDEISKFPGVVNTPEKPIVGVSDMSDVGTQVLVKFFIRTKDFPGIILPIQSHIRQILADNKVPMVDPF